MFTKLLGKFDFDTLGVEASGKHYVPPTPLGEKIEATWEQGRQKHGERLWNGINYRLEKIETSATHPKIYLGTADYKCNFASKTLAEDILLLPFEDRPNCMFIGSLLQTTDDKFILGKTAAKSTHGQTLQMFGGILNKDEQEIRSGADLESYLYKELEEELKISAEHIDKSIGLGIYEIPTWWILS